MSAKIFDQTALLGLNQIVIDCFKVDQLVNSLKKDSFNLATSQILCFSLSLFDINFQFGDVITLFADLITLCYIVDIAK